MNELRKIHKDMETRAATEAIELRAEDDDKGPGTLVGYAAVFDVVTDLRWYREKIDPAAFATFQTDDVRGLFNHDPNMILGRNKAGTLRLSVDSKGLRYEIDLPDNELGHRVADAVKRGDVSGSSFGFRKIRDRWEYDDEDNATRTLLEVELFDVSPVVYPAYEETDAGMRSLESWKAENAPAKEKRKGNDAFLRRLRMAEAE